jgi:Trk K+ transport system NAD-binding subunit
MTMKVALIGFSNAAYRTAWRLAEAGAEVLFFINQSENHHANGLPEQVSLCVLPFLHPHQLPELADCQAAIIATENEQFNLHATMQLHSQNPQMRIVTRCFNLALGREIEERLPGVKVLSVSDQSAPFFAAAAFRTDVNKAWREEKSLKVNIQASNNPQGQVLTLKASDYQSPLSEKQPAATKALNPKRKPDKMLLGVLAGLASVIGLGSLFFVTQHSLPPGDALYFVVTTLTTTGYGDYSLKDFPFMTKLVGMSLMLAGASLFAILFALITDKLFQLRIEALLGQRRVKKSHHIIVCGAGDVGFRVIESLLLTGSELVVIEKNPEGRFNASLRESGLPLLIGDASLAETLERAGIHRAQTILCATNHDMNNLEIALNARQLNPQIRIVARVYDRDFAEHMRDYFGLDVALSSSAIAAQAFAEAALN